MFNTLTKELGDVIGLDQLGPDETGALTLSVDGMTFTLQYYESGEEIYIIHRIGPLPEDDASLLALQGYLLESNCFFRHVGPGTLGIEGRDVFYTVRVACRDRSGQRLSGAELEVMLRGVVDTCRLLREGSDEVINRALTQSDQIDADYLSMLKV